MNDSIHENGCFLTGGHSLLVNDYSRQIEKSSQIIRNSKIHDKYLSFVYLNEQCKKVDNHNFYNIYHIVLENNDIHQQYGIFIVSENPILCETMSESTFFKNLV